MEGLGVLLVVVAAFIANLPALREEWRTDRAGSIKTIWLFGVYLLYIGLGIVVVLLLVPREGGHGRQGALPLRVYRRLYPVRRSDPDARRALPRAASLAHAFRHRRHRAARGHARLPRRLSLGISLLFPDVR